MFTIADWDQKDGNIVPELFWNFAQECFCEKHYLISPPTFNFHINSQMLHEANLIKASASQPTQSRRYCVVLTALTQPSYSILLTTGKRPVTEYFPSTSWEEGDS